MPHARRPRASHARLLSLTLACLLLVNPFAALAQGGRPLKDAPARAEKRAGKAAAPGVAEEPRAVTALTFVVNSTGDGADANTGNDICDDGAGNCTLRAAIGQANATAGTDAIHFNIPGAGVRTIAPASALPAITEAVVIDGYTQPGASADTSAAGNDAVLLVELDGTNAGGGANGLHVTGGGSTVRGLVVNRFGGFGVYLNVAGGNTLEGNFVGTDAAGAAALGNGLAGVSVELSAGNSVTGNVVSGNGQDGVLVFSGAGNVLRGNLIGTTAAGTAALGNNDSGVFIRAGAPDTVVGGPEAAHANVIAFNENGDGVLVQASNGNRVQGNSIHSNGGLGIRLDLDGNDAQTAPVLTAASASGGGASVSGTLSSLTNASFTVEFFASAACDPTGRGEGARFLGSTAVITNGGGEASFSNVAVGATEAGEFVTATAIHTGGDTSEFSQCLRATAAGAPIVVTTTADSGAGSLRQAILDANAVAGTDAIHFNLPGAGVQTIAPASALPAVTSPVVIDGYTQPGASANTLAVGSDAVIKIELDGSAAGAGANGLSLTAGGSTVRGLAILDFGGAGVLLSGGGSNTVSGNFIGTNAAGASAAGAGNGNGVVVEGGSAGNTVGGATPAARNVISGNDAPSAGNVKNGVVIRGAGTNANVVAGNYVGTNPAGTSPVPNGNIGIHVFGGAQLNRIGGTTVGERNVVSANLNRDIVFSGAGTNGNLIRGNYVGTNAAGDASLGGGGVSVSSGAKNNTIGGSEAGARNVLAGSSFNVSITDAGTTGNAVLGNYIGTNAAGTAGLSPNASGVSLAFDASGNTVGSPAPGEGNLISGLSIGVFIFGASNNDVRGNLIGTDAAGTSPVPNSIGIALTGGPTDNRIGGTGAGAGNLIAFNGGDGVLADSGTGNSLLGNSVHSNGSAASDLGIDLDPDGVNANDAGDADSGPNNSQNFPVLSAAVTDGGATTISGTLNSTPATAGYRVEFFMSQTCDASGNGEGQTFVGALSNVTTDASGDAALSFSPQNALPVGRFITATATDSAGNTSEFSACRAVTAAPQASANLSVTLSDSPDPVAAGGQLTYTVGVSNAGPDAAADVTVTDTLPAGVAFVSATSPAPGANCAHSSGTVTCNLNTLSAGASLPNAVTIVVNAPNGPATLSNTASVASPSVGDPDASDNSATATTAVSAAPTHTIAGRVLDSANNPLADVTLTLSGSQSATTQTDAGGNYSFAGLAAGGDYVVSPARAGFAFTPPSRRFDDLAADQTADFTAARASATISGRVAGANDQGVAGVSVALTDANGATLSTAATDAAGNYAFGAPVGGSYAVTPSRAGLVFAPPAHFFADLAGDRTADFTALEAFSVSGNLRDLAAAPGLGLGGIVVTLSGTRSATAATDADGNYTFAGLPSGGDYRVTPQDSFRLFAPPFRAFENLRADADADFGASQNPGPTPTPPIREDFSGPARDPDKFSLGTLTQPPGAADELVSVAQLGGRLVVTPRADFSGLSFNGYVTTRSVDFTNATASVEVAQAAAGGAQTVFAVGRDEQNFFRFVAQEREVLAPAAGKSGPLVKVTLQQLILQARVGGVFASQPPLVVNYDPVAHRHWRFRHDTTTSPALLKFEASPTGQEGTYVLLRAVAVPGGIGSLAAELGAGTAGAVASPGQAVFDNLGVEPAQAGVALGSFGFADAALSVAEGAGSLAVRVRRTGNLGAAARVELASEPFDNRPCSDADGKARARCDFSTAFARLDFAPGEAEKTATVFVTDDVYAEGAETFRLALGNPSLGFTVGAPTVTVTIADDDAGGAANPVNSAGFFVRQQYVDFLSREPDAAGFDAWTNVLRQCAFEGHFGPGKSGSDPTCDRILVSSGFYRSDEFHARGFFVYRFYEAALGRLPLYEEFLADTARLAGPQTPEQQEANKRAFVEEFMARGGAPGRQSFNQLNGTFRTAAAVDALLARANVTLPNRDALVADLEAGRRTPAETLRLIAESEQVSARFYNRAFVAMQYFGYLQRDPEPAGFQSWLSVLDATGDFRTMIFGFLYSAEYQSRFGPAQ